MNADQAAQLNDQINSLPPQLQQKYRDAIAKVPQAPDAKPNSPEYLGSTDANGQLQDKYKLGTYKVNSFDQVNADPTGLNKIKEQAYNQGPSAWAQLMNQQQSTNQGTAMDASAKQNSGANAMAMSGLASRGGLSGGSAERLAMNSQKNNAFNQNSILRQGLTDKQNIGLQDQTQKASLLKSIPGMDMDVANLKMQNNAFQNNINQYNTSMQEKSDQYNSTAAMTDQQNKNSFNQNTYDQQMKDYAAGKQSDADKYAADHQSSWLCTEANKTMHFYGPQKKALADFLRSSLKLDRETVRFYLTRCQTLVERMKEKQANWVANAVFVLQIIDLTQKGKLEEAYDYYCDHTIRMIDEYWPECQDQSYSRIKGIRALKAKGA